jgi:phosphohistidine phosphatase
MEVKDVCFVRHAKSSWDQPGVDDYNRSLDSRGLRDAPMMAKKMHEMNLVPDLIITSGAKRARLTADFFRKEFDLSPEKFIVNYKLYEATAEDIYSVIASAPETARFIYIFGHNPTLTWVANSISGVHIDNVPTTGVVHVQTMVSSWKKFKPQYAGFISFHYPKLYIK